MSAQSGIAANDELLAALADAKQGSIRLVHMQIEDEQIKLRKTAPVSGSWQEDYDRLIHPLLEPKTASYILYRLDSQNNLGYEWMLLTWIPDESHVLQKTLYASTRVTFRRQFGDGYLADDILCHDKNDICLDGYLRHLAAKEAPVPLTQAEKLAMEQATDQLTHASMNEGHSSMGGIAFALTEDGKAAAKSFADGQAQYVQFLIDIPAERITSSMCAKSLKPEEIASKTPPNSGSYHLYRFDHQVEGEDRHCVFFLHAIAGYQSPIKERMLYSSCKRTLMDSLSRHFGISVEQSLEIEDFKDVTRDYLMDTVYPKKMAETLAFSKPKGPGGRGPRRVIK